jgi:alkaline phosphatase D
MALPRFALACSLLSLLQCSSGSDLDSGSPQLKRARSRHLGAPLDAATAVPADAGNNAPDPMCADYRGNGWNGEPEALPMHPPLEPIDAGADSDAGAPFALTSGPIVGDISDHGAKIWIRGDRPANWDLRYWSLDTPTEEQRVHGGALDPSDDLISVARIDGLAPAQRDGYEVDVFAADGSAVSNAGSGSFRTLPPAGQPLRLRFTVGADITGGSPQPIFERLRETTPDFALFIGDQIYADTVDPDFEGYAHKYRANWSITELDALMSNVPVAMMWDDHEIIDGFFPGGSDRFEPARRAFELYAAAHNPRPYRPGVLYYTLRAGDVALFVLDDRSFRSPPAMPDGPDKSMLGAQQKADLLAWLSCEPAALKVIVSSVVFTDFALTGQDAWRGYAHEREELFAHVISHRIDDVLLVTGDQHWSAVFREPRGDYAFYEFLPTPLSKDHHVAPLDPSPEIVARDDDQFEFGVVDIDTTARPATIALTLCRGDQPCSPGREPDPGTSLDVEGAAENVPFTIRLTAHDLGFP